MTRKPHIFLGRLGWCVANGHGQRMYFADFKAACAFAQRLRRLQGFL